MEDFDDPTESLQETVHEHAEHGKSSFTTRVAVTTAILAVLAAITSMLAGHHANEAMIKQIKASDQWAYYQAKGIKAAVTKAKMELLEAQGETVAEETTQQHETYKKDQDDIAENARELESDSEAHLGHHMVFARGVTLFQVAIAISAVAVLSRKAIFWYLALALGSIGCLFLVGGFFSFSWL